MASFIGIDLGTTYSLVSYLDETGRPQIIRNDEGHSLIPSCIEINDKEPKPTPKPQPKPKQESRVRDLQTKLIKIDNSNCSELTKEFKEWNDKMILSKTDKESKDIQKILDRISKTRMDKNC